MKYIREILISVLLLGAAQLLVAQNVIPKDYFSSPLRIALGMTGSFGEVRPNHLHSGIDFQIQKTEGLSVYAAADGVVSRIKVSPVGFGNALYIDHPNGFTSVYAHLKAYNDTIAAYVLASQYRLKSFDIDVFPAGKKEFIRVKKGQLIGYAGNSGSSGGPHLHFEIRDTHTERTINPLLFSFPATDKFLPYFDFIKIYPDNSDSYIGNSNEALRLNVKNTGFGRYSLAAKDTLALWGKFSFGVQAFDFNQNQSDRNGWYSLEMLADKARFFSLTCDSFAFDESRYINATIDFAANYDFGNRIVVSKKLPGSRLSVAKTGSTGGVLDFSDNALHEMLVKVADQAGNMVSLRFWVQSRKPAGYVQNSVTAGSDTMRLMAYNKLNRFEMPGVAVEIPAGSLYDNIKFRYRKSAAAAGLYSDIHYLHDPRVPLQSRITVSVKADRVPANLRSKALLVRIDRDGKRSSAGGSYADGFVTVTTNLFDGYAITVDTAAPVIKPYAENVKSKTSLRFRVSDDFSGIAKYRGELNGKWVLVQWDPKNLLMQYKIDHMAQDGNNKFTLFVSDDKGNSNSYTTTFVK